MWRLGLVLSDIVASPRPSSSDNVCVSAGPRRDDMHYSLRLSKLHLICESAVRVSHNDMLIAVETLKSLSRRPCERKSGSSCIIMLQERMSALSCIGLCLSSVFTCTPSAKVKSIASSNPKGEKFSRVWYIAISAPEISSRFPAFVHFMQMFFIYKELWTPSWRAIRHSTCIALVQTPRWLLF